MSRFISPNTQKLCKCVSVLRKEMEKWKTRPFSNVRDEWQSLNGLPVWQPLVGAQQLSLSLGGIRKSAVIKCMKMPKNEVTLFEGTGVWKNLGISEYLSACLSSGAI